MCENLLGAAVLWPRFNPVLHQQGTIGTFPLIWEHCVGCPFFFFFFFIFPLVQSLQHNIIWDTIPPRAGCACQRARPTRPPPAPVKKKKKNQKKHPRVMIPTIQPPVSATFSAFSSHPKRLRAPPLLRGTSSLGSCATSFFFVVFFFVRVFFWLGSIRIPSTPRPPQSVMFNAAERRSGVCRECTCQRHPATSCYIN